MSRSQIVFLAASVAAAALLAVLLRRRRRSTRSREVPAWITAEAMAPLSD